MSISPKPLQVLLVEDSQEDIFFFKRALAKSGVAASLHIAEDGKQAIDLLAGPEQRQKLDIVFLDLKMPLVNGFDVLRWLREQAFAQPLLILVLSGSPHESDRELAAELGAAGYLVKPITAHVLAARLQHVLGKCTKSA